MFFDDEPARKRTLGVRDRQILYRNAKKRCENPGCGKKLDYDEMQVGHKTAYSKGGATSLKNSACLCYRCNKLQGTDSWAVFLKKQNVVDPVKAKKETVKQKLQALTITQLKALAAKHGLKVQGKLVEDWFETKRVPATKTQYVTRLSAKLSETDLRSIPKANPKKAKPKAKAKLRAKKKNDDDSFWW